MAPVFQELDIKEAIARLKNHKAAFPSLFSPELLKYFISGEAGSQFAYCLTEVFNTFAMCGLPVEWN